MHRGFFRKPKYATVKREQKKEPRLVGPEIPEGLWVKCPACMEGVYRKDVKSALGVCPNCEHHFRIAPQYRISQIIDSGTWQEFDRTISSKNPIDYPVYAEKIQTTQAKIKQNSAVCTGKGRIGGMQAVVCIMDSRFLMGSMGSVVGEKLTRAIEYATENKLPIIIFSASGGARMQEGIFSLMQMAKTSAALARHSEKGLLYVSVLTDPTTGGVTASFAMLGDIIIAEPKALVGFAGPRVIEQTIRQKLPEGFQRSEFLLEHGIIDQVIHRKELKSTLHKILYIHH